VNRGSVFFFHTELCHIDRWFNREQELWYLLGSWCFGSAQNLAVLSGKFLIHPVVVHHFENLKTCAINHNKFYYSLQHIVHVLVIIEYPWALNAWYLKLKINCICIYRICTNSIYMHLCVCVRARARARAHVRVHACTHLSLLDQSVLKMSNWWMQKCLDTTLGVMRQWKWQR
jgi:hypothetical protein